MKAAIDNLKQKPKEQKNAVAGGVATAVVAILLIAWAFFYMRHILNTKPSEIDLPTDPYNLSGVLDGGASDESRAARLNAGFNADQPFGEARGSSPSLEY